MGRPIEWVVIDGKRITKTQARAVLNEAKRRERQAYKKIVAAYHSRPMVGPKRVRGNFSGHARPAKTNRNAEMIAYYLDRHTLQETGDKFGVSRERVRQILKMAGIGQRFTYKDPQLPKAPRLTQEAKEQRRKARFWLKVDITVNPDECWNWNAGRLPNGHGHYNDGGNTRRAERAAYMQTYGKPKGWVVQTCKNALCCNPAHLRDLPPSEVCQDYRSPRKPAWVYRNEAVQ